MEAMRVASQRVLISQQKDISNALANLAHAAALVPCSEWFGTPNAHLILSTVISTVCGKAMTPTSAPQPCADAIAVLLSFAQVLSAAVDSFSSPPVGDDELEQLLEPFLYHALHQSVKALWTYGENHPTLVTAVESVLLFTYRVMPYARSAVRSALYASLKSYLVAPPDSGAQEQHSIVSCVVSILVPIVRGFSTPLSKRHVNDLLAFVVPLLSCKQSSGSMSAVEYFVSPVTSLIRLFLSKVDLAESSEVTTRVFRSILSGFHEGKLYPSVGILIALHRLMEDLDGEAFDSVEDALLEVCSRAAVSDFPAVATKGLQLFQLDAFVSLAKRQHDRVMLSMAAALHRTKGETHWDLHVRREMLRVWDLLNSWDAVIIDNEAARSFDMMLVDAWQGDNEAVARFRKALQAKVAEDTAAEDALKKEWEARQDFDATVAVVRSAVSHLQLVFGRSLGGGAFGSVRYAKMIERTVAQSLWYELAVKQLSKATLREQECEGALQREIEIHSEMTAVARGTDNGIVPLYHTMEDDRYVYLLTKYSKFGDLFDTVLSSDGGVMNPMGLGAMQGASPPPPCIVRPQHLTWVAAMLRRVGRALALMHREQIFYGDVKPENVLLVADKRMRGGVGAALLDFGASMKFSQATVTTEFSGTLAYCSPEILRILISGEPDAMLNPAACDAWSFGCLIIQLLTGDVPFSGCHSMEQLAARQCAAPNDTCFPLNVPPAIRRLLSLNPEQRPSLRDVLSDPWFELIDDTTVVPPAKVVAGAAFTSRNSGRRESMMWKRAAMDDVRSEAFSSTSTGGVSTATALLEEEESTTYQVSYKPRDCMPAASAALATRSSLPPYLTVMPKSGR